MKIISIPILQGDNQIELVSEPIEKIEFQTNDKQYWLKFMKTNNFDNRQELKLYDEDEPINSNWFSLCDKMSNLKILSTCSGVFTVYIGVSQIKNPVLDEIAQIKNYFEYNYYLEKYFSCKDGGFLLQYDRLKNFKYYRNSIPEIISYLTPCYQNVKSMSVPQMFDYIYAVEITSDKDTMGSLQVSGDVVYTWDIKKGTHEYPLVIPRRLSVYTELKLVFNDVVTIKYIFFNLSSEIIKCLFKIKIDIEQYPCYVLDAMMVRV